MLMEFSNMETLKYLEKNLFQCHFVHQKSHRNGLGVEPKFLQLTTRTMAWHTSLPNYFLNLMVLNSCVGLSVFTESLMTVLNLVCR